MDKVSRDSVSRAARIYKQNEDASDALGISLRYFARLCRQYEIRDTLCTPSEAYSRG